MRVGFRACGCGWLLADMIDKVGREVTVGKGTSDALGLAGPSDLLAVGGGSIELGFVFPLLVFLIWYLVLGTLSRRIGLGLWNGVWYFGEMW